MFAHCKIQRTSILFNLSLLTRFNNYKPGLTKNNTTSPSKKMLRSLNPFKAQCDKSIHIQQPVFKKSENSC